MKYTTRLYLGFGLIIIVITIIIASIVGMLNNQNQEISSLVEDRYEKIKLLNHIRVGIKNIDKDVIDYLNHDNNHTKNEKLQRIRETIMTINEDINTLNGIIKIKDAKEQLQNINAQIDNYQTTIDQVVSLVIVDDIAKASSTYETSIHQYDQIINTSETLIAIQERIMEETLESTEYSYSLYVRVSLFSILIALILGFGISQWVIRNITKRFQSIRDVMKSIQYGSENLPRLKVLANDEIGEIASAYNQMANALEAHERMERQYTEEVEEQNWLSVRLADLSMLSQEILDISKLGETYLGELVPMVEASYGSLYIVNSDGNTSYLQRVSTYAGDSRFLVEKEIIEFGEGLVGQCAKDGKVKNIVTIPRDYISITSSLGESKPNAILIVPIHLYGDVVGVLELATLSTFSHIHEKLLSQATNQLGITIYRINQQMQVRKLLEESQALNEELQSQSEEMQLQQEELRTINEELEAQYKHSEQKTKDLEITKKELEESTQQLQLNSKYKSEFLANMSHELRTPLNSLLILAQILLENKENNLTDKQKEYATTIHMAGKDLLNLINDILDLAKIESGKIDIQYTDLEIEEMVRIIKKQFDPLAEQKQIEFNVVLENNIPKIIYTDEQKVFQILKNLLSNAIKFTEEGKVNLNIKREVSDKGEYISFEVKDTGIGISYVNQQLIFEAFQQADGTTSRKYGGTGLGLSISKELASLLSGYIKVESKEGEGSTFAFLLPATGLFHEVGSGKEAAATTEEVHPQLVEDAQFLSDTNQDQALTGKEVLVVDDDMRNVFSLTTALETVGMKVSFAENGKESIRFLENNPETDIVLMDIMMPEMDGYEAMKKIRQDERFQQLPIVALTAKAMGDDRKKCIEAGASDYITKPVKLEQLFSLLKVWLYK
jgi:two-component system, chemotaxis family, sensor kinase CheA